MFLQLRLLLRHTKPEVEPTKNCITGHEYLSICC